MLQDNKPLIVLFKINGVQNGEIRVNLNYRKRIYGKLPYKVSKNILLDSNDLIVEKIVHCVSRVYSR